MPRCAMKAYGDAAAMVPRILGVGPKADLDAK